MAVRPASARHSGDALVRKKEILSSFPISWLSTDSISANQSARRIWGFRLTRETTNTHPNYFDRLRSNCHLKNSPTTSLHMPGRSSQPAYFILRGKNSSSLTLLEFQQRSEKWSGRWDLNPRPLGPEPSALPSYATPRPTEDRHHEASRAGLQMYSATILPWRPWACLCL